MRTFHKFRTLASEAIRPGASDKLDSAAFVILLVVVGITPFLYAVSFAAVLRTLNSGSIFSGGNMLIELLAFLLFPVTLVSRTSVCALRPM